MSKKDYIKPDFDVVKLESVYADVLGPYSNNVGPKPGYEFVPGSKIPGVGTGWSGGYYRKI